MPSSTKKTELSLADRKVRAYARRCLANDGVIEVDEDAVVSRAEGNPDGGAYVAAWLWVYDKDAADTDPEE